MQYYASVVKLMLAMPAVPEKLRLISRKASADLTMICKFKSYLMEIPAPDVSAKLWVLTRRLQSLDFLRHAQFWQML